MRSLASMSILAVLALAGCHAATQPPGCDVCTTSAIVYGRVQTTSGTPVNEAEVKVEAHRDSCAGPLYGETNLRVFTRPDGTYRDQPLSLAGPFNACLVVRVMPPDAAGLAPAADSGASVPFRADYPPGQSHDSVRVDVVIPTSG
jgi:hypothetical protein